VKIILSSLLSVFCFQLLGQNITNNFHGQVLTNGQQLTTVPSAPSLTCQTVASTGYAFGAAHGFVNYSQKIKGSAGGATICGANFARGGNGSYYCEVWSGINRTGTQYGGPSATVTGSGYVFYSFTWTTNPVVPPNTDYVLVFVVVADDGDNILFDGDTYLPGEGYDCFYGSTPMGVDLFFTLNLMQ
jgi:hypothetical protein